MEQRGRKEWGGRSGEDEGGSGEGEEVCRAVQVVILKISSLPQIVCLK